MKPTTKYIVCVLCAAYCLLTLTVTVRYLGVQADLGNRLEELLNDSEQLTSMYIFIFVKPFLVIFRTHLQFSGCSVYLTLCFRGTATTHRVGNWLHDVFTPKLVHLLCCNARQMRQLTKSGRELSLQWSVSQNK